ncbi:MAG TPA: ABC transporter substrate-binding protein [Chloroflexota bacterium]|nr:ABC transporter substrate-binding protein [Chloroflexota bacterium]
MQTTRRLALGAALWLAAACAPAAPPASAPAGSGAAQSAAVSAPAAAAPAAPAPTGGAAPGPPIHLNVATQHLTSDVALYAAQEKGYFTEQGLDVELVDINTGQGSVPALAAGQLDVGVGAVGSGLFNAIARGIDVKLVMTKGSVGTDPQGPFTGVQAMVLSADLAASGAVRDYRDLKGRTIGLSDRGSGLEIMVDRALKEVGLTLDDVEFKNLTYPDMLAALANRSVDAGMELEPFIAQGQARGILTRWKTGAELYPGDQAAAVVYGPTMAQMGRDAGNRLAVAYTRGLRDYHEAFGPERRNRAEIVAILTRNTTVKDPALYDQMGAAYMNPDCYLNADAMAWDLDWYVANGYVPQKPDLTQALDNGYCDYAVQVLGRYQP